METFADYILNEKNLGSKMEIVYYLSKKEGIFFDKSVVFKTELLRMFLNGINTMLDTNVLLTASLLVNCKKIQILYQFCMRAGENQVNATRAGI